MRQGRNGEIYVFIVKIDLCTGTFVQERMEKEDFIRLQYIDRYIIFDEHIS